MIENTN